MPFFAGHAISDAPPEEIWKLLYDPARIPDWWAGVERVRGVEVAGRDTRFELFTASDPELPMPQLLRGEPGHVVISCLTLDAHFDWRLTPEQEGTRIDVELELPEERAALLDLYSESAAASAQNLARLASASTEATDCCAQQATGRVTSLDAPAARLTRAVTLA